MTGAGDLDVLCARHRSGEDRARPPRGDAGRSARHEERRRGDRRVLGAWRAVRHQRAHLEEALAADGEPARACRLRQRSERARAAPVVDEAREPARVAAAGVVEERGVLRQVGETLGVGRVVEHAERDRLDERERPGRGGPLEGGAERDEAAVRMTDEVRRAAEAIVEERQHGGDVVAPRERGVRHDGRRTAVAEQIGRDRAVRAAELPREPRPLPRREPAAVEQHDRLAGVTDLEDVELRGVVGHASDVRTAARAGRGGSTTFRFGRPRGGPRALRATQGVHEELICAVCACMTEGVACMESQDQAAT